MVELLATVALIGSGTVAGVFFAIAVSVMPTLMTLPAGSYLPIHRELGKGYHPVMPLIVLVVLGTEIGLAILVDDGPARALFGTAAVATVGVQLISQLGNVPINKRVQAVDEAALPADWRDPRRPWRDWHYLRTGCAFAALAATAIAVALR